MRIRRKGRCEGQDDAICGDQEYAPVAEDAARYGSQAELDDTCDKTNDIGSVVAEVAGPGLFGFVDGNTESSLR